MWSNDRVIEAAKDFVAAADEVWRLQRCKDAECRHFQAMAGQGHYRGKGGTRQGIYVLTPGGTLLASINALDAGAVLAMMRAGLAAWQKTDEADRRLPEGFTLERRRWEASYPEDGLVLRSLNADLGPDLDRTRRNRDHVWFSAREARGWLGTNPEVGAAHRVPRTVVDRLARFHLVDNVRGQTLPFVAHEVADSRLTTTVTGVRGSVVTFRIEGRTRGASDGSEKFEGTDWVTRGTYPRLVRTKVLGSGQYDTRTGRFTKFEFVAVGERTGRTDLNGRAKQDVRRAPIGFYFELAPDRPDARVPPAYIDLYGADWVVDPR